MALIKLKQIEAFDRIENISNVSFAGTILIIDYIRNGLAEQKTVDLAALAIDVQVSSVTYDDTINSIVVTESNGDIHTVAITDLLETIVTGGYLTGNGSTGSPVVIDPLQIGGTKPTNLALVSQLPNVAIPLNEFVFGTGTGVTSASSIRNTSSGNFIDLTFGNLSVGSNQTSGYNGAIGFNRSISTGLIFDSNHFAYQLQNNPDDNLELQVYNASGIVQGTFLFEKDLSFGFYGALKPAGQAGSAGQVLTSSGAGAAPTWVTIPAAVNPAVLQTLSVQTATAAQTVFTLPSTPADVTKVKGFIRGVMYYTGFTVVGTTATWGNEFTLDAGDEVVFEYFAA